MIQFNLCNKSTLFGKSVPFFALHKSFYCIDKNYSKLYRKQARAGIFAVPFSLRAVFFYAERRFYEKDWNCFVADAMCR